MAAIGGIFGSPELEGVEGSDENGQRARVVGLDLESGVVRVRGPRTERPQAEEPSDPSPE